MNWFQIAEMIIGVGEEIVPLFIHNPKSQKVEAVVVTTLNNVMQNAPKPPTQ